MKDNCNHPYIEWRKADKFDGPDEDGWSIVIGANWDGEYHYANAEYCPNCGINMPKGSPQGWRQTEEIKRL